MQLAAVSITVGLVLLLLCVTSMLDKYVNSLLTNFIIFFSFARKRKLLLRWLCLVLKMRNYLKLLSG